MQVLANCDQTISNLAYVKEHVGTEHFIVVSKTAAAVSNPKIPSSIAIHPNRPGSCVVEETCRQNSGRNEFDTRRCFMSVRMNS